MNYKTTEAAMIKKQTLREALGEHGKIELSLMRWGNCRTCGRLVCETVKTYEGGPESFEGLDMGTELRQSPDGAYKGYLAFIKVTECDRCQKRRAKE